MNAYDYVVVGGGSAGCAIASRLSEDPEVTVCLLEAGGPDKSVLIHAPVGVVAMMPTKINNYGYETVPQKGLNGRKGYQPRGKTLGGSRRRSFRRRQGHRQRGRCQGGQGCGDRTGRLHGTRDCRELGLFDNFTPNFEIVAPNGNIASPL
ncbi:Oxygen-dependent choline dehydrogenase [Cupriavidus pinatubonensis]|uniref:Oxygen-dependent choline dehydrogenase n=1 Tax=Cupriavidus pinatubonensis TaxID=248026 RepID=A0ABN7ZPB8_9BURK|nr:Oxygen-dependent choline dehydrogenase [Cupriavidus pinatubonensis]